MIKLQNEPLQIPKTNLRIKEVTTEHLLDDRHKFTLDPEDGFHQSSMRPLFKPHSAVADLIFENGVCQLPYYEDIIIRRSALVERNREYNFAALEWHELYSFAVVSHSREECICGWGNGGTIAKAIKEYLPQKAPSGEVYLGRWNPAGALAIADLTGFPVYSPWLIEYEDETFDSDFDLSISWLRGRVHVQLLENEYGWENPYVPTAKQ